MPRHLAGRGNTRMRSMLRTYAAPKPRERAPEPIDPMPLEIPDEGRSTWRLICPNRKCGWRYYPHTAPARCLNCQTPLPHHRSTEA